MSDKQEKKAESAKVATIHVRSTGDDRKVLFWERDPAHPTGEIFIVNNGKTFEVGETSAIKRLLGEEKLERVNWNSREAEKEEAIPSTPPGRRQGRKVVEVEGAGELTPIAPSKELPKP